MRFLILSEIHCVQQQFHHTFHKLLLTISTTAKIEKASGLHLPRKCLEPFRFEGAGFLQTTGFQNNMIH